MRRSSSSLRAAASFLEAARGIEPPRSPAIAVPLGPPNTAAAKQASVPPSLELAYPLDPMLSAQSSSIAKVVQHTKMKRVLGVFFGI